MTAIPKSPPPKTRGAFKTGVATAQLHDSAALHVTGRAAYVDDLPDPPGLLHAALVLSPVAHGELLGLDTTAAKRMPGVVAVVAAADIPGKNDIAPIVPGEPLFAEGVVEYAGQPVAAVIATTMDQARAAAALVTVKVKKRPALLTVEDALAAKSFLCAPMVIARGNAERGLAAAPHRLKREFRVGGQEHFYLEGQIALAIPGEHQDFTVYSSTQHPTEVQHICARLLATDFNKITTVVRRLGGGFGGKESNASWVAGAAVLFAHLTGRPVKLRLPRETDMIATGKRHGFLYRYEIGYDDEGRILALDAVLAAHGGNTLDHTSAVVQRALTHVDNCYWVKDIRATGYSCKTHTVSNTAFRGYGGPQGVVILEDAIEHIARKLGRRPEDIQRRNLYGPDTGLEAPYGQTVDATTLPRCIDQVMRDCGWEQKRREIDAFNAKSPVIKRGLGLFPLKFGISFTKSFLNQAGALVHVYADGSIRLNHGGTEMGQGLFIKVAQVVAEVFQVDVDRIAITSTSTGEVPNTSPTAASTGSDLNGWAAHNAALTLKRRMAELAAAQFGTTPDKVEFRDNHVHVGAPGSNKILEFGELAKLCWLNRVSLSATGFYKTPDLDWDAAKMKGRPFYYFSHGAAAAEVAIDTLTGEARVLRTDIVQDCGRPLNPAVDLGQIEGGFVQGMGWFTNEELWWDADGRLRTVGPSTYKIPGSRDVPPVFNVRILEGAPAGNASVFGSKGIGEPPLLLATAVWTALKDAIGSVAGHKVPVALDAPATAERILAAVHSVRAEAGR